MVFIYMTPLFSQAEVATGLYPVVLYMKEQGEHGMRVGKEQGRHRNA